MNQSAICNLQPTQHYKIHQPIMAAVRGNLADNQIGIKVGLLETQQKTTMPPEELCFKGRRAATSRAHTEGREIKCKYIMHSELVISKIT